VKHLTKFHPNRTVNEAVNAVLRKLRRPEKSVAPGGMKLPPGGSCSKKSTKNSVFRESNTMSHWYDAWRPNGCRQAVPALANLTPFTTTLIYSEIPQFL